jgi:hypothetical protein
LRDDARRELIVIEIWNRLADVGAAARSTARKRADVEALGILAGGDDDAYGIAIGWLPTETAANRRLVSRYPAVCRASFPGSSVAWVHCLLEGGEPPAQPAIAWIDVANGRLIPMRIRGGTAGWPDRSMA